MEYTDLKVGMKVYSKKTPSLISEVVGIRPPEQGFPNGIIDVKSKYGLTLSKDPEGLEIFVEAPFELQQ